MSTIGTSVPRLEDPRLLTGRGRFHDDIVRPGQLYLRVVRSSPRPTAGSPGPCTRRTHRAGPGSRRHHHRQPRTWRGLRIPVPASPIPASTSPPTSRHRWPREFVRYVGEPVAAVLAEDPHTAEDAADLVRLDLADLPVQLDARAAAGTSARRAGTACRPEGGCRQLLLRRCRPDVFGDGPPRRGRRSRRGPAQRHAAGTPRPGRRVRRPHRASMTIWGATKVPYFNRRVAVVPMLGPARIPLPHAGIRRGRQLRHPRRVLPRRPAGAFPVPADRVVR